LGTTWRTAYGGKYTITLIHGDGVGPELMEHVKTAIRFESSSFQLFFF
jgi:isocitrate/isopropylmalate dehydrogenase